MKLNYKRTLLVGLAFLSISAFWQLYDAVVPLILKNTFDMPDDLSGVIMALDNVLALFLLPLFGKLSDKCDTRFGRRMPFIVGGTACAVVFMNLLPVADRLGSVSLFVVMLGFLLVSMGVYRSPAVALMPDVTPKPLRSKGNAIINLMGALGGVFTLAVTGLLVHQNAQTGAGGTRAVGIVEGEHSWSQFLDGHVALRTGVILGKERVAAVGHIGHGQSSRKAHGGLH